MIELKDCAYLEMAYGLAEKALGKASPNPYVGAVVVKKDIIVGHGYHEEAGKPHAEAIALERAGKKAKGSTVYITLEPCVHWGRTPPCVDQLLASKPGRVVVSALDPNPLVCTKGIRRLKESGIRISTGLMQERNERLNEAYIKYITKRIPFVAAKMAISLDGRTATQLQESKWISSKDTREYVQLLRGEFDALMTGVNTILKDNPRLTVRHPNWGGKKIPRVIVDSNLRTPPRAKIFSTLARGKILIFASASASKKRAEVLEKRGAEVEFVGGGSGKLSLKNVLSSLGKREITSVLVEAGSRLLTSLLEGRLVDKMILTISPILIGGEKAPSFFEGRGIESLKAACRFRKMSHFELDRDLILEGYF